MNTITLKNNATLTQNQMDEIVNNPSFIKGLLRSKLADLMKEFEMTQDELLEFIESNNIW